MNIVLIRALCGAAIGAAVSGVMLVGFKIGESKGRERAWIDADKQMAEMEDRLKRLYKIGEWQNPVNFAEDTERPESMDSPEHELARRRARAAAEVDPGMLEKLNEHVQSQGYALHEDSAVPSGRTIFDRYRNEDLDAEDGMAEARLDALREEVEGVTPNMEDPEPYVISEEEFGYDKENYTKISLSYYPVDGVVADEQDRVVEDVESSIGIRNLDGFDTDGNGGDTVIHVRNNRLQADFEIAIEEGSYRETVMGLDAGPVMERRGRKSRGSQDE